MSPSANSQGLNRAVQALKAHGVVPAIAAQLRQEAEVITATLQRRVTDETDAVSSGTKPEVVPELHKHLEDLVYEVCRLLADLGAGDLAFVRSYAQRRAQQRFPLEASLHAYRCSHQVLSRWIRDRALGVADSTAQVRRVVAAAANFAIEYTDAISTVATAEYVMHTRLLAEAEGGQRTQLFNMLLSGYDESDNRAGELLKRADYLDQRRSFCVAVARSVDPREMENTAGAQRMVESVGQVLQDTPVRSLVGIREGLVTAIISGTRDLSGWTAPESKLAARVYRQLNQVGPAALIGLSNDARSSSHVPRALNEACLALDFANVARRVMPYAEIPFRQMIVHQARGSIRAALPAWFHALLVADRKARGSLSATLRAYADANMNVLQTAKMLTLHPNTIYARFQKIDDVTGKNALIYHDLTELLLAMDSGPEEPDRPDN